MGNRPLSVKLPDKNTKGTWFFEESGVFVFIGYLLIDTGNCYMAEKCMNCRTSIHAENVAILNIKPLPSRTEAGTYYRYGLGTSYV